MNLSNIPVPDVVFQTSECAFYEGYFMAFQSVGVLICKIGLVFFIADFLVGVVNRFLDEYFQRRKKK